jgi:hypothetical protein
LYIIASPHFSIPTLLSLWLSSLVSLSRPASSLLSLPAPNLSPIRPITKLGVDRSRHWWYVAAVSWIVKEVNCPLGEVYVPRP